MADLRPVAAEIAAALPEPVLVVGSLPDDANDLDLLAPPTARVALEAWLPNAGFVAWHGRWMRLAGGRVDVVELDAAASWGLPDDEVDALFSDAGPVDGAPGLLEPAPHHCLLLLARRAARHDGHLDHRRLARAHRALTRAPDALADARTHASAWRCAGTLELVAAALEGRTPGVAERRELLRRDGVTVRSSGRVLASRLRGVRRRPGAVVALSGLDGSGKSTLAEGLIEALDALGYDSVLLWHRLSHGRSLLVLAAPVKALVRLLRARPAPSAGAPTARAARTDRVEAEDGLAAGWAVVVTLVHVLTVGPITGWHLRRGRVVVRDRYVLDALLHLTDRYGGAAPVSLHRRLLQWMLPRPEVAWYLDVTAEQALLRKAEQFGLAELARQRTLYLQYAGLLGVRVVDGTAPPRVLRTEIVRELLPRIEASGVPWR